MLSTGQRFIQGITNICCFDIFIFLKLVPSSNLSPFTFQDGHEICFVGDEAFRELSQPDINGDQLLDKVSKADKFMAPT